MKTIILVQIVLFSCFLKLANAQIVSDIDCFLPAAWEGKETKLVVKTLDKEAIIVTATVTDRHAKFKLSTSDLSAAYIWLGDNQEDINFLIDSPQINITFDPGAVVPVFISGSPSSIVWQQQQSKLKQIAEEGAEARAEFIGRNLSSDSLLLYEKLNNSSNKSFQDVVIDMIRQNVSLPSSWYLFADYYRNWPYRVASGLFDDLSTFDSYPSYKRIQKELAVKSIGKKATDFTLHTVSNQFITLSKLKSKFVLVDFSDSHLIESQQRHILLKRLYERYHSSGLDIITIFNERSTNTQQVLSQKEKLPWPVTIDAKDNSVFVTYLVERTPDNLLIDSDQKVVGRDLSIQDLEASLKALLKK